MKQFLIIILIILFSYGCSPTPEKLPEGFQDFIAYSVVLNANNAFSEEIFIADTHTGKTYQITDDNFLDNQPIWSPDGTKLAFLSRRSRVPGTMKDFNFNPPQLVIYDLKEKKLYDQNREITAQIPGLLKDIDKEEFLDFYDRLPYMIENIEKDNLFWKDNETVFFEMQAPGQDYIWSWNYKTEKLDTLWAIQYSDSIRHFASFFHIDSEEIWAAFGNPSNPFLVPQPWYYIRLNLMTQSADTFFFSYGTSFINFEIDRKNEFIYYSRTNNKNIDLIYQNKFYSDEYSGKVISQGIWPSLSKDKKSLVYCKYTSPRTNEIFSINLHSMKELQITHMDEWVQNPKWAP